MGALAVIFCYFVLEGLGSSLFSAKAAVRAPFSFSVRSALFALVLAIPFFAVSFLVRFLLVN